MTAPRDLLILGTGGLAKEIAQLARSIDPQATRWSSIEYVAASADEIGRTLPFGKVCWVDGDLLGRTAPCDVVIGVGYPQLRRLLAGKLLANPCLHFPNIVHPSVELDERHVKLGRGNILTRGVVMTCDIEIGDFNLFNWNTTVGHDARIGSFNVLNPAVNISGNTVIGDACLFGTGCQLIERLSVTSDVTIGAGAVVVRSIDAPGTYVGVPAGGIR